MTNINAATLKALFEVVFITAEATGLRGADSSALTACAKIYDAAYNTVGRYRSIVGLVVQDFISAKSTGNVDAECEAYERLCREEEAMVEEFAPKPTTRRLPRETFNVLRTDSVDLHRQRAINEAMALEIQPVRDLKNAFEVKGLNLTVRARNLVEATLRARELFVSLRVDELRAQAKASRIEACKAA